MQKKLLEHTLSIFVVSAIFVALIFLIQKNAAKNIPVSDARVSEFAQLEFLDFGDPLDRALFKESLNSFYPDSLARNDSLLQAIDDFRREQFANALYKTGGEERGLTWSKLGHLLGMYLQFIVIFLVVMALSYYGAQMIGIIRFVQMKQHRQSYFAEFVSSLQASKYKHAAISLLKACARGVAYLILFSPAYVIAYSFKTEFATDSYVFMILLSVTSNGLLINYANRFYTFLVSESRKGYIETAIVKNLHTSYQWNDDDGISWKTLLQLKKKFSHHVFQHIYMNAHHQFVPTLKEHASFLITGLVIIEMALNIQGHLSYEMLKNILYKEYDVVMSIVLGIFLLVKATEIAVDVWAEREARMYENK